MTLLLDDFYDQALIMKDLVSFCLDFADFWINRIYVDFLSWNCVTDNTNFFFFTKFLFKNLELESDFKLVGNMLG